MSDTKKIKFTEDPLTNIKIMIPMLNDRAREAVSYFMYGCYIGGVIEKEKHDIKAAE